jgi:prephenate dehydrogenase
LLSIPKLTVIGVGLIGGSLVKALRREGVLGEVVGAGRGLPNLRQAAELGVIDRYETDLAAAVAGADMVVVATPVCSMGAVLAQIAPALGPQTIVTDVGSVKGEVVAAARKALGANFTRFVPGHPIAGTEKSGVGAAFPELFEAHKIILTPLAETDPRALETVREMWRLTGAEVMEMSVEEHDRVLAVTSHLPHVLAYALVDFLANCNRKENPLYFKLAAGGFYDFTRIASSDPEMWRDICLMNREELAAQLRSFHGELDKILRAVEEGDGAALESLFAAAREARAKVAERRQHNLGRDLS